MPAANQGPRGAARPRRWAVASLLAWGPRTGPVARVAARLAATLCPAPDHFGRVAAGSEDAPPPLANQSAGRGCRAGFGRAADATWERARARHVGGRPRWAGATWERRTHPEQSHSRPPPLPWGTSRRMPNDCSTLGQRQNSWEVFVKVAEGRLDLPFLTYIELNGGTFGDSLPGTKTPPSRFCGGGICLNG